jgi:hypothetical protein
MQHENQVHTAIEDLNYYILAGSSEAIKEAVIYGEWNMANSEVPPFHSIRVGDILLFYCLEPINGAVGFATIKNKSELNGSCVIEFSRNYCLPSSLWKEEKISFDSVNRINKGVNLLGSKEEVTRVSSILSSKWGAELKNDINVDMLEAPFFSKNKCLECGKELESRLAKYCSDCSEKVKSRQSVEWNKKNIDKIREANRKWRLNNPDKLKEYRRRWKEAHREEIREKRRLWKELHPEKIKAYREKWKEKRKKPKNLLRGEQSVLFSEKRMSDWCRELRKKKSHIKWMTHQKKRYKKVAEIEDKFNCYWEDKFKEVFEGRKHREAAKILNLDYHTLFIWAKHLELQRVCSYCHKKLSTAKGTFHLECKIRYESNQQSPGVKELFSLIDPAINIDALNLKDENIRKVVQDVLSTFPRQESLIVENRYLFLDRKQTLEELGKVLRVTRERVRQIEQGAIKKLSHPTRQKIIREGLSKLIFKGTTVTDSSLTGKIDKLQIELNQLKQKLTGGSPQEISNLPIAEVELSVRASNCLRDANIKTIGELANKRESDLLSFKNLGKKTLWELREILHSFGLKFNSEAALSVYQRRKDKPVEVKKKCLFAGCNVTPQKGKYCSRHKMQQKRLKAKEKCKHFGCNIVPRKGKYCSIHKPRKKTIRDKKRCLFAGCKTSPREGKYCSRHKNHKEAPVIKAKCLFPGCNIVPQKKEYCSKHKTSWQRKRALELLETKKETQSSTGVADKKHSKKYTIVELKEIHSRLHPRA